MVGYNTRGNIVASYSAYSTIGGQGLTSEAMGGIVGFNYNTVANVYGCYSTHVSLTGSVSGNDAGIGSIAGYTNGNVTSCYAILPEGVTNIELVGKNSGTIKNCVNTNEPNYTILVNNVSDLNDDDGSVWKAIEIWEFNASGIAPTIDANYIGESSATQP